MSIYVYEKKQNRISEIINPALYYFLLSFFLFPCKECGTKCTCISSVFGR